MKPEICKDLCTYPVIKSKIIGCYLPDNIIRNVITSSFPSSLFTVFVQIPHFRISEAILLSPFQNRYETVSCCTGLINHRRRNRKIFRTGIFIPVLEILLLPELIDLMIKYRLATSSTVLHSFIYTVLVIASGITAIDFTTSRIRSAFFTGSLFASERRSLCLETYKISFVLFQEFCELLIADLF